MEVYLIHIMPSQNTALLVSPLFLTEDALNLIIKILEKHVLSGFFLLLFDLDVEVNRLLIRLEWELDSI